MPRRVWAFLPPRCDARANFAVIELAVRAIEWLQVLADQRRAVLHSATNWAPQPLAP
jgi:hypothetical protein